MRKAEKEKMRQNVVEQVKEIEREREPDESESDRNCMRGEKDNNHHYPRDWHLLMPPR